MTTLSTDNRESLGHAALCLVCDEEPGAAAGPAYATVDFGRVGNLVVPVAVSLYAPLQPKVERRLADCRTAFSLSFQRQGENWIFEGQRAA